MKEKEIKKINDFKIFFLPQKLVIGDQFKDMNSRYLFKMPVNSRHLKTTGNLHVVTNCVLRNDFKFSQCNDNSLETAREYLTCDLILFLLHFLRNLCFRQVLSTNFMYSAGGFSL